MRARGKDTAPLAVAKAAAPPAAAARPAQLLENAAGAAEKVRNATSTPTTSEASMYTLKPMRSPGPAKKDAAYVAPRLYASLAWLRVSRRPLPDFTNAATLLAPQNASAPCAAASPGAWQLKDTGH